MKRFILPVTAAFFALSIPAVAQETDQCRQERDTSRRQCCGWYIGADGGAQVFFGRNDKKMSFPDRVTPDVDITVGRKLGDVMALDLTLSNSGFSGIASPMTKDAHFIVDESYVGENPDEALVLQEGYMMNLYLRVLADMTNLLLGRDCERRASLSIYAGGGLIRGCGDNTAAISPSINAGLICGWHFCDAFTLNLTLRGALVSKNFEGEHCDEHIFHAIVGAGLGLTYSFGKKRGYE